jgi:hypothetical protein
LSVALCAVGLAVLSSGGTALAAGGGPAQFSHLEIVFERGSSIALAGPKSILISGAHLREVRAVSLTEQGTGTFPLHFQVQVSTSGLQSLKIFVPAKVDKRFKGAPTEQLIVSYVYLEVVHTWSSSTWFAGNWLFGDFQGP